MAAGADATKETTDANPRKLRRLNIAELLMGPRETTRLVYGC
jgi:hypothetical protein